MHLLILEFVALYIHGVQLVSLIVLSIGSLNQCFVNKVDELNESVPMDVDRCRHEISSHAEGTRASQKGPLDGAGDPPSFSAGMVDPAHSS